MLPAVISTWFVLSLGIAFLGRNHRFGFWGYLFGSILLSPVIGLLLFFSGMPVKKRSDPSEFESIEERAKRGKREKISVD